jgi:thioredoxin reductase (NADPH)
VTGQRNLGLTAVLRGGLEVFESRDGQEQILATPGPRDFIGEESPIGDRSIIQLNDD